MGMRSRLAGLGVVSILLSGCAANLVRVESAGQVSAAASAMVARSRDALDFTRQRRKEAAETLVASDPSCIPGETLQILVPNGEDAEPAPLCASGPAPAGYRIQPVSLRPIADEAFRPTLLLLGAVADYGSALSKIVERADADISAELSAMAAKAGEAVIIANALLSTSIPDPVKLLADEQVKSALAILDFVQDLSEEAAKVRDIRNYMRDHGGQIEAKIVELANQIRAWLDYSAEGDAQIIVGNLQRAYGVERNRLDYQQRLAFVQMINQARAQVAAVTVRKEALERALATFQEAQTQLRNHLDNRFDARTRARIARLNRERMLEAIGLVARAMIQFGVTL
jgi:hypothetical protein